MPSAVKASWTTMAELAPATVSNPYRGPWATLLATISATFGPGISIRIATAPAKARKRFVSTNALSSFGAPLRRGSSSPYFRAIAIRFAKSERPSSRALAVARLTHASLVASRGQRGPASRRQAKRSLELPAQMALIGKADGGRDPGERLAGRDQAAGLRQTAHQQKAVRAGGES